MKRYFADKIFFLMIGLEMTFACPFVFSKLMARIGIKNSMSELAETAAISWGAWANSKVWGGLIS